MRKRKRNGIVDFIAAVVIEKIHIMKKFHKTILKVLSNAPDETLKMKFN